MTADIPFQPRICQNEKCGRIFTPERNNAAKYCCPECSTKAYRQRLKAQKGALSTPSGSGFNYHPSPPVPGDFWNRTEEDLFLQSQVPELQEKASYDSDFLSSVFNPKLPPDEENEGQ